MQTAQVDMLDDDSMVRYGGFISDNENEDVEASAVKDSGKSFKKPSMGLYACTLLLRLLIFTQTLFKLIVVCSDSKESGRFA